MDCTQNYTCNQIQALIYQMENQIQFPLKNNKVNIWDYKFVKHMDKRGHFNQKIKNIIKMKFPLTSIEDINIKHYTLQLSIYAYMLQQINPNLEINKLIIVHFNPKGIKQKIYVVDYLKEEVEKLLIYYKKTI